MMIKVLIRKYIFLVVLVFPFQSYAQDSLIERKSYDRLLMENAWLNSENEAGNIFNGFIPDGEFVINTNLQNGDLKLSQLTDESREYNFSAKKIMRLKDIVFDGGVAYQNQQQEHVGWTGRMNPLTNNPYMIADSIYGLASKDYVNLFGGFGYKVNNAFSFGINVDYLVGDGARIKDPRPVNDLFELNIYPSFIYSLPKLKIGANLHLNKGREKISYTTIETSATYRFFRMLGLGKGAKTTNSWSASRNYYSSGLGADLQFEYSLGSFNAFTGIGYFMYKETSEDGSSNPRKNDTGDYQESALNFYTLLSKKNKYLHSLKVYFNMDMGEGIEFIQEPYLERNITYYRTVAEVSKYSMLKLNPGLNYKLAKPYNDYLNKWGLDAKLEMNQFSNEYLLEAEQSFSNIVFAFKYNYSIFFQKNQLEFGLNEYTNFNLDNNLNQLRNYSANQEISVWENIVYPDFLYYTSNSFSTGAHLKYGREVHILIEKTSQVYIDLNASYSSASNVEWSDNKTWQYYGIKIGITY